MYQFFIGFAAGIYVGTLYNCKPTIEKISEFVSDNMPEKK